MEKEINGILYVRVEKGMYGIYQEGIIVNTEMKEHIWPLGYEYDPITPGLWRHNKNGIAFTLVINNFRIK